MPSNLPKHLQDVVDDVCHLGCERVNEIIHEVESGNHDNELAGLKQEERIAVVDVLKRVMSVYTLRD